MAKRTKGIIINSMIKDAKAEKWGFMLDGKPVSEFKFMQRLKRELRGEVAKKQFYWTDQKVMAAIELSGARITPKLFREIKQQLSA
jgi:hypothetical protein